MNQRIKYHLFIILLLNFTHVFGSEAIADFQGKWAGIEVMGGDKKTAQMIRDVVPIKKGEPFSSAHSEKYKEWCHNIKVKIKRQVECGFIGYPGGEFYYNVEITDKKEKNKFRIISNSLKNNIKIEKDLLVLFNVFDKLYWTLLPKGIFPI